MTRRAVMDLTPLEVFEDMKPVLKWRLIVLAAWTVFIVGGFTGLAVWAQFFTENPDRTFLMIKVISGIVGVAIFGAGFFLLVFGHWRGKEQIQEQIYPTEILDKFPPRPAPIDGDWQGWLERGIRIGKLVEPGAKLGKIARLRVIDTHILAGGESRMGKSKFIANFMYELDPAIDAGAAEIILIDPSYGMEFGWAADSDARGNAGAGYVKRENFFYGAPVVRPSRINGELQYFPGVGKHNPVSGEWEGLTYEETFVMPLEVMVEEMTWDADNLRMKTHSHIAKKHGPHKFLIIDEGSRLAPDTLKPVIVRDRINRAISTLTNMGAKCGWTVLVATQYPAVDEIKYRRGLISGVCLAVRDHRVAQMVLGRSDLHPEKFRYAGSGKGIPGIALTSDYGPRMIRLCNNHVEFDPEPEPGYELDVPVDNRSEYVGYPRAA